MATSLDLDAYFERVGRGGEARPTRDTLTSLPGAHTHRRISPPDLR